MILGADISSAKRSVSSFYLRTLISSHILVPSLHRASLANLNRSRSLVLWQRGKSEIWLDNSELGEEGLGLVVLHAGVNNDIVTWDPVDWGGDSVLIASLEGVDHTKNLSGITASGGRVGEDEADCLFRVNDEDRADSECNSLGVDIGGILVVKPGHVSWESQNLRRGVSHIIGVGDFAILVTDDREA